MRVFTRTDNIKQYRVVHVWPGCSYRRHYAPSDRRRGEISRLGATDVFRPRHRAPCRRRLRFREPPPLKRPKHRAPQPSGAGRNRARSCRAVRGWAAPTQRCQLVPSRVETGRVRVVPVMLGQAGLRHDVWGWVGMIWNTLAQTGSARVVVEILRFEERAG